MILRQYTAAHERRSAVARFRESLQRCTGRRRNIALATLLIIASAGLLLGIVAAWLM